MHTWGDENFDWKSLNEAITLIGVNLRRWGRVGVRQMKEKFGTACIYCSLGWGQLHDITHPGHCFSRYPKWLWMFDIYIGSRIVRPLNVIVLPYHRWLYRFLYQLAVKKYPHIHDEILCCADYPELLKGI